MCRPAVFGMNLALCILHIEPYGTSEAQAYEWYRHMITSTPFDDLIPLFRDLHFEAVREWKAAHPGRPIVGIFPVWAPAEIVHAAGALPICLFGAGDLLDIEYADARMQSFLCSISRSTLELGLRGKLDFLDGMIFTSLCDVARNLSGVWERNFPDQWVIYLHWPENVQSPHAMRYMRAELTRLQTGLEQLTGTPLSTEQLHRSIHLYNENRRLLRALYAFKQRHPHRLSTYELYILARAGSVLPVERHNAILQNALHTVESRTTRPKDRIRVLLDGSFCEQPPLEFIWAIEEAGCYILDDDFLLGNRYLLEDVPTDGDPLDAIARTYLRHATPSAIRYDGPQQRAATFLAKARQLRVDGVIFAYAKFCDPAQFDFIILKRHLEDAGIPYLILEFEEKMTVFEQIRSQVETFVESILFYA